MNRFWSSVIQPVLNLSKSKKIVEIGSFSGINTRGLIEYINENDGVLYSIDPSPQYDVASLKEEYGEKFEPINDLSISALPLIKEYDAILIDGDHNWYTVYHELKIIEQTFRKSEKEFPVTFLHDIDWPYGRRDMYYNPENIPGEFRQPYKKEGIKPGQSSLLPTGLNSQMYNSIYENNPRNGVLTAIEDFLEETQFELKFFKLHGFYGLGIIIPASFQVVIDFLNEGSFIDSMISRLEEERVNRIIQINDLKSELKSAKDKNDLLNNKLDIKSAENEELSFKYNELTKKNYELLEQIDSLSKKNIELIGNLKKAEQDIISVNNNIEKIIIEKNRLHESEKHYRNAARIHVSSIRYQLGDTLVSSVQHPKKLLKLPKNILKIIKDAKKKRGKKNLIELKDELNNHPIVVGNTQNKKRTKIIDKYNSNHIKEFFDVNIVSIIIPVYNAYDDFTRCIESILKYTNIPYELIIVNDCSTDLRIKEYLVSLAQNERIKIIENESNKGYVESINIGINASQNDVVLLNSDTIVTNRWLLKLKLAAYSESNIGTVTPFSNAAGAFSVPLIGEVNEIPNHLTIDSMAKLVEGNSVNKYPKVPTGNGFCMYIKRKLINEIGGMDSIRFHRGYGEENDFCMRALKSNWYNIIDDSTYIYHKRSASFSDEKQELIKKNRAILDELHPEYTGLVSEFVNSSDLNSIREDINKAIENPSTSVLNNHKRVLYVLHQGSGGTPNTNKDLMNYIEKEFDCFVLTSNTKKIKLFSFSKGEFNLIQVWELSEPWKITDFTRSDYEKIYFNILTFYNIDLVHIRHLLAHSFDIAYLSNKLGLKVVLSFHDFYFVCPSIHLLDNENVYCAGKCTSSKGACQIPSNWVKEGLPELKNQWIHIWRGKVNELIEQCDAFVTTSNTSKQVYTSNYPALENKNFIIIEHGRDEQIQKDVRSEYFEFPKPQEATPIKILLPGNIDNHKGSEFIKALKEQDVNNILEFHFLGKINNDLATYGVNHGVYKRDEFYSIVHQIKPSFVGIFSIWPETYCHTLSEAWICGIPVLATRIGTIEERILKTGGGWLIDFNDPKKSYEEIIKISRDKNEYERMVAIVNKIELRDAEEMSRDYSFLYKSLIYSPRLKRVGVFTKRGKRGYFNPSGYIRLILPLTHPSAKERLQLEVLDDGIIDRPSKLDIYDVIIVQRDCLEYEAAQKLVENCKTRQIALVFEVDDDFLSIDQQHPEFDLYRDKIKTIRYLLEAADIVTVSSEVLREKFIPYSNNIYVLPNVVDERIWFPAPRNAAKNINTLDKIIDIVYIGSNTHSADLQLIQPAVEKIMNWGKEEGYSIKFYVIGGDREEREWYNKIIVPKGMENYIDFIKWVKNTNNFTFALAPLVDNKINNAKSYLKYLDYGALGLPALYSDIEPFRLVVNNGVNGFLCNDTDGWFESMKDIIQDSDLRSKFISNIQLDIKEKHLLKDNYLQWVNLICGD
ncbi:glycosyltransferase [Paenibacillus woosongensis]|uniref:Glycosyltransferase n=1 Tax=Paenibacillus woosongensis TaxID=307580 RepID=A0AA95IA59_9BACL|nr:glycosyltransferase [Paenibacillus woosongensis]WHX48665.1 glycosyltransferase [Paenibacillus woosongensis]